MQGITKRVKRVGVGFAGLALLISVLLLSSLPLLTAAAAETSPDATVKEIVTKMKAQGNPSVVVDYVNWDKAFADFPEKQREQLNVTNPQELKGFFFEMLAHPTETMRKQMEKRLSNVPPERQEEAKQSIVKIEEMMRGKEAEMKERLTNTTYEVGEVKVEGSKATVKLIQTYKDQKRTEDVPLEKEGGRWMLPSVSMVPAQQQASAQSAPPPSTTVEAAPEKAPAAEKPAVKKTPAKAPAKTAAKKPTAKKPATAKKTPVKEKK